MKTAKTPQENTYQPKPEFIEDFVVNLSSKNLSTKETNLLNKGLKFVPPPNRLSSEDLCTDIMSAVKYLPEDIKDDIDHQAHNIMKNTMNEYDEPKQKARKTHETISGLRRRKLIITKYYLVIMNLANRRKVSK